MSRQRCAAVLAPAIAAVGLVLAAPASAVTTIGSNLAGNTLNSIYCPGGGCTFTSGVLPAASQAPGGLTSPINGVVVRWRIKEGSPASPVKFRVLRRTGPTGVTAVGSSEQVAPPTGTTSTYEARLPIKAGDSIGLDAVLAPFAATSSVTMDRWEPPIPDGVTAGTPSFSSSSTTELLLNADVEADADNDGFGDETQDGCPTDAAVQGPCPILTPPVTAITKHPKKKTNKKKATFEFISDIPASTFECTLDGNQLADCTSPMVLKVNKGKHVFEVRAINAGASDATPARYAWKVGKKKHKGGKGK